MSEQADLLERLRAALGANAGGTSSVPPRPSRYDPAPRDDSAQKEVENLKLENRDLKRDNLVLKRQLDSIVSDNQAKITNNHDLLSAATEALFKANLEVQSLKMEIKDQARLIAEERKLRHAAETTMHSSKTQQSQLAKDKNELEQKLKRLEAGEGDLRKMAEVIRNLELSNNTLRQQVVAGTGHRGRLDSLQEKCKTAELQKNKAQDQLRHVRIQNDAMRLQLESLGVKNRSPSQGNGRGRGRSNGQSLVTTPTTTKSILKLVKPDNKFQEFLTYVSTHILDILKHLPKFIKSLILIYQQFSQPNCSSSISTAQCSTSTSIQTKDRRDFRKERESKADSEQDELVKKLTSEKGLLTQALKDNDKELMKNQEELMKAQEELEDQRTQNRALIEEFKAQERESQRYKSKKREKATLKQYPVIPSTPAFATPIPTQPHPVLQARPEILLPTPHHSKAQERDFQLFSDCSSTTDFTEELRNLAELTGRPIKRKEEDGCGNADRDQSRFDFDFDLGLGNQVDTTPKPKPGVSAMDDLAKQIKGMTIKKPDPYGDIDKAFASLDRVDIPRRSMVATVEDEEDHESPVQSGLKTEARTSPVSANEAMYGPDYA